MVPALAQAAAEKEVPRETPVELLPAVLGDEWKATSGLATIERAGWQILPDAEIWAEYGLQRLSNRHYRSGKNNLTVELFVMRHTAGAYGLWTYHRRLLEPTQANREEFAQGRYLVRLTLESGLATVTPVVTPGIKDAIRSRLGQGDGQTPVLPAHLPETNKIAGSETYLLGPKALSQEPRFKDLAAVIDFQSLPEMATADYQHSAGKMGVLIVEFYTPQAATDNHAKLQQYFQSLPPADQQTRIVKRIGNYLVEAVDVGNREEAEALLGQIKYEQKVYWSGRKLSDIPFEFRPLDPAVLREATRTGAILIRSLIWIGMMLGFTVLIGMLIGGSFFYWRRYRRRKMGLDNLFSDAGGTILLNLDDYLLHPGQMPLKQLEGDFNAKERKGD